MLSAVLSRLIILVAGVLYPAYGSFKAVRTRNMKSYVRWMIYWIVFALYSSVEAVTDMFVAWIPFYYEIKILTVLWLVSPATRGCMIFFKRVMQPMLETREKEIDSYISSMGNKGYGIIRHLGSSAMSFAFSSVLKGHMAVMEHVKSSYLQIQQAQPDNTDSFTPSIPLNIDSEVDRDKPLNSSDEPFKNNNEDSAVSRRQESTIRHQENSSNSITRSSVKDYGMPLSTRSSHIPITSTSDEYSYSASVNNVTAARVPYVKSELATTTNSVEESGGSYYERYVKSRVPPTSYRSYSSSSTHYGSSSLRK